jgi:hypothetical protein
MTIFKDTITIKDTPWDRAVQVTVIAPDGKNGLNLQELAERAWRSIGKTITVEGVTVKVRAFGRMRLGLRFVRPRVDHGKAGAAGPHRI